MTRPRHGADPFRKRIAEIYALYQQRLLAANAMDFDDLLHGDGRTAAGADDDVRDSYQERFKYMLVDEFQDTNGAQNEIVKLLGEAHGNVCVVGDSDQSVYRWRGADVRNILQFEQRFPDADDILLEQNFRSTQTILDAANAVIANNVGRQRQGALHRGRRRRADHALPGRGRVRRGAAGWPSEILRLHAPRASSWGDVAVFYRTNAQSLPLERSMKFSGIPYKVVGGAKFYDRQEIKDILAYVRVLANPDDEVSAAPDRQRAQARHRRHLGGPARRLGPGRARVRSARPSTAPTRPGLTRQGAQGARSSSP